jgi:RNA polymerase sigma-70 factor (ECF subfamily)
MTQVHPGMTSAADAAATDADLVRASLVDPERFEAIFRRHARAIFAFVAARVGPQHAEDITSDVFAIAFQRRASFDERATTARPWLYGIAVNKLRQHGDSERRWLTSSSAGLAAAFDGEDLDESDARLDARARIPALLDALEQLTPAERDVLVLHVLEGLSHAEIATALGIRKATAKVRLHRGRARLRAALDTLDASEVEDA